MLLALAASKLGRWVVLLTTQAHAYQLAWWGDEVQFPAVFQLDSSLGTERCIARCAAPSTSRTLLVLPTHPTIELTNTAPPSACRSVIESGAVNGRRSKFRRSGSMTARWCRRHQPCRAPHLLPSHPVGVSGPHATDVLPMRITGLRSPSGNTILVRGPTRTRARGREERMAKSPRERLSR